MQRSPSRLPPVCVLALVCVSREALAAPGSQPKATTADMTSEEVEARARFDRGVSHFDNQEYREALEQFRKSIEKKKTRNAMGYVASCLKQLGQYDEALDQYEQMRRDYPTLPAETQAKVVADMAELAGLVGTLVVTGDTPAGTSLFIDDRLRGKLPLDKPLRVSAGSRAVRVEREGFDPITATVDVKAGKKNEARLAAKAKARKGRLVVTEKHNWALRVEVDGADVGVTPYRGLVDVGKHQVRVRGYMSAEALSACDAPAAAATEGAKVASGVEAAVVRLYEETPVVLGAEEQDASLRVESTTPGAQVVIDRKAMGKAPWDGRLPLGEHVIEVSASGFVSARQTVRLERRKQRELSVVLQRASDREAELRAARNARIGVGLTYGAGAVGLGVFAVAGGLALGKANGLKASCPNLRCPSTETANLNSASTLGTASTVGLVVAGIGAAAGTTVLLLTRTEGRTRPASPSVGLGVGLGSFEIHGRF